MGVKVKTLQFNLCEPVSTTGKRGFSRSYSMFRLKLQQLLQRHQHQLHQQTKKKKKNRQRRSRLVHQGGLVKAILTQLCSLLLCILLLILAAQSSLTIMDLNVDVSFHWRVTSQIIYIYYGFSHFLWRVRYIISIAIFFGQIKTFARDIWEIFWEPYWQP